MNESEQRYQSAMNALRESTYAHSPSGPQSDCLDDELLAAFADGSIARAERLARMSHLGSCRRCKHELASIVRALNDTEIARAATVGDGHFSRLRVAGIPLVAAAAILLAVFTRPDESSPRPEARHRAPVLVPAAAPLPTNPVGPVVEAFDLRWSAVSGADRYRVTLFTADGRVLYKAETTETYLKLPESLSLAQGSAYHWKVDARTDFDRWVSSELVEFRVVAPKK